MVARDSSLVLAAFKEYQNLVHSTHTRQLTIASSFKAHSALLWPLLHVHSHAQTHIHWLNYCKRHILFQNITKMILWLSLCFVWNLLSWAFIVHFQPSSNLLLGWPLAPLTAFNHFPNPESPKSNTGFSQQCPVPDTNCCLSYMLWLWRQHDQSNWFKKNLLGGLLQFYRVNQTGMAQKAVAESFRLIHRYIVERERLGLAQALKLQSPHHTRSNIPPTKPCLILPKQCTSYWPIIQVCEPVVPILTQTTTCTSLKNKLNLKTYNSSCSLAIFQTLKST